MGSQATSRENWGVPNTTLQAWNRTWRVFVTFLGWFFVTLSMAGLGLQLGDISGSRIESLGIFWVICMERKGLRMNSTLIFEEDFHAHRNP